MSTLSDVQSLYGSVRDAWANSRAHVIAHVACAVVVFVVCGASSPQVPLPNFDPKQISENEWFKLAKDTGIVYLSFVLPLVLFGAYAALLRAAGRVLVSIAMVLSPNVSEKHRFRLVSTWALEPLALSLGKTDFDLNDLRVKASELQLKYQARKDAQWEGYQKALGGLTKNAQEYLGDFLFFLLAWIALFEFLPDASWVRANHDRLWPVAIFLAALAVFAWFRVFRAVAIVPSMQLNYVSLMVRADAEMTQQLKDREAERTKVIDRLEDLLKEQRERADSTPSLIAFISHRIGFDAVISERERKARIPDRKISSLYEKGRAFAWDTDRNREYDDDWFAGYLAYLYFLLCSHLMRLARGVWMLVRYVVTGAP